MTHKAKLLLIAFFTLFIFTACSTQATSSPTPPSTTEAQSPLPTKIPDTATVPPQPTAPSITDTETPLPATEAPIPPLASLHMQDEEAGWAWSTDARLLRTSDGGQTWIDRTPEGYQTVGSGFFLDAQTAWLPAYLQDNNRFGLVHTTDGGQSWMEYPQGPASGLYFSDALNGWAVSGDVGAGNVYYSLSQTSDGGRTWTPVPLKSPSPEPGLMPGTIHLCNICNDAFYYDPDRAVIVYGDMGSMEPGGSVSMEVSFDMGNTWQKQDLTLPQGEADALVAPNAPVFFDNKDGILPIHLIKIGPDGSYTEQRMVFYATADNGASWQLLPATVDDVPLFTPMQVASAQDIFIACGEALCASHDTARTWQAVSSDLDFTQTDTRAVSAIDFVNSQSGWALLQEGETTSLYQTIDSGAHWVKLSPHLAPTLPPTVTVDTSIPTPTQNPGS